MMASKRVRKDDRWQGELSEERVHRVWRGVHSRLERDRQRSRVVKAAGGLALAATVLVTFLLVDPFSLSLDRGRTAVTSGAVLRTEAAPMAMTIEDGSTLSLKADSTVELVLVSSRRVALQLEKGEVSCDVAKRPSRDFSVMAGDIEVRVVGTKFSVVRGMSQAADGAEVSTVEVGVERGVVEIWRRGQPERLRRLVAGQTWATEERVSPSRSGIKEEALAELADRAGEPQGGSEKLEAESNAGADGPKDGKEPPTPAEPMDVAEREPSQAANRAWPEVSLDLAKEQFEAATQARRSGDAAEAARRYEQFLRDHSGDPRAGLAAFELGRLRMDSLGNSSGALAALQQALRLSPRASFREDVLARIARAYARMGQDNACAKARDAYQREFPGGVHQQQLDTLCP